MKHKTFLWFVLPSSLAMLLFILLPLLSIAVQSLFTAHEQVVSTVTSCGPFGCTESMAVDREATAELWQQSPLGRFAGFATYLDRAHLATDEVAAAWHGRSSLSQFLASLMNLPFYKALAFTLAYTAVVTPLTIALGLIVALAVNNAARVLRGPLIFVSLLPMIITPLVGALILFWMVDSRGILGAALIALSSDPDLSVKASTPLMWVTLMIYGVWHATPFAFIIYYAGLQTVSSDTLESAMVDGAGRWLRVRHVILPHLMPLTTFIALIQLMDNFRVFEPIISFSASAHATSLSWSIFNDLGGDSQLLASAAATSVLTVIGVAILLSPVLLRTWRDFRRS